MCILNVFFLLFWTKTSCRSKITKNLKIEQCMQKNVKNLKNMVVINNKSSKNYSKMLIPKFSWQKPDICFSWVVVEQYCLSEAVLIWMLVCVQVCSCSVWVAQVWSSIPALLRSSSPSTPPSASPAPAGMTSPGASNERRKFRSSTSRSEVPPPAFSVWSGWRGDTRVFMCVQRTGQTRPERWLSLCLVRTHEKIQN